MMELYLIRHGKTFGNTLGRYIGTTDEELCTEGRESLVQLRNSALQGIRRPDFVFASPLKRCLQTARILFPEVPVEIRGGFRECDFGEFENRNYQELSGNPAYQAWIDSGGKLPFPGGESRQGFEERCRREFRRTLLDMRCYAEKRRTQMIWNNGGCTEKRQAAAQNLCLAFVVHGGTIMSILSAYGDCGSTASDGEEKTDNFYRWQVKNAEGFRALWDERDKGGIQLYGISHISPASGDPA